MIEFKQIRRHNINLTIATIPFNAKPSLRRSVALFEECLESGEPPVSFWGFSYGSSRISRTRAAYEVYERLFAYRSFRRSYLPGDQLLPKCFTFESEPTRRIPSKYLFVRESSDHSAANGGGAHTSLRAAIEHGLDEVVERHLLCRWWYESAFQLQAIGPRTELQPGVYMSSWTVSGGRHPFCVAVIFDDAETVFVTGSKVASTLNKARIGAEREAFMLWDSLPREPAPDIRSRITSLRGMLAEKRIAHFRASLDEGQIPAARRSQQHSHAQRVAACGMSLKGAKYAILADLPRIKVVKVHCPGWLTKAIARTKYEHSEIPPDPFC